MIELKLKPREDRRLRTGHLWAYSNELQTDTSFRSIAPGSLCRVSDDRGKSLGIGYVNPHALLSVRLLADSSEATIDAGWFARRIESALALRQRLYDAPYYRLVHGESDGLPGLVVDRFGEYCVVQLGTAGMENLKAEVIAGLQQVLQPSGILLRNDGGLRELEGLPAYVEAVGEVPDEVELLESGVRFLAPLRAGQKTGWFYDQRDNRDRLARYVRGARVLDVFSYAGAWALRARAAGATEAVCVDRSQPALDSAQANAALNGLQIETHRGEALEVLRQLRTDGRSFDVVIVDPPALVKRKKDHDAGLEHYAALNRAAMNLLAPDGILVSCSCSFHLAPEDLQRVLLREGGRRLQLLEQGGQGPDHPVHPAIPETRYLKAYYCRLAR